MSVAIYDDSRPGYPDDYEPPCTCIQHDVDLVDARGCELHDESSDYNRQYRLRCAERESKQPIVAMSEEEEISEEVPF